MSISQVNKRSNIPVTNGHTCGHALFSPNNPTALLPELSQVTDLENISDYNNDFLEWLIRRIHYKYECDFILHLREPISNLPQSIIEEALYVGANDKGKPARALITGEHISDNPHCILRLVLSNNAPSLGEFNQIHCQIASEHLLQINELKSALAEFFNAEDNSQYARKVLDRHRTKVFFSIYNNQTQEPEFWVSSLKSVSWKDIANNYTSGVRKSLLELMKAPKTPGFFHRGRILLFTGEPGTGKTHALRAIVQAWMADFTPIYVTDIDQMFNNAKYFPGLIKHFGGEGILIILEDAGEYIYKNAKERQGQGFSRLLNLGDGFMSLNQNICFLITTNENLKDLHPAIIRRGRTGAVIDFESFSATEAEKWLKMRGNEQKVRGFKTLAELFGLLRGEDSGTKENTIGFA